MGLEGIQELLENEEFPNCLVHIDLIKLARTAQKPTVHQRRTGSIPRYSLVVDGECCLDRLYGGFYSDWVCGGQWNRMVQFVTSFTEKITNSNIDIIIFFNGCVEQQRMNEWISKQKENHSRAIKILKHIDAKGTPPPKAWWFPPVGLHLALRTILRHNNISLVLTMDDHHQEVIAYCRENDFNGLIADDADYIAFDPPRLFSAKQIKLTYKGYLISKEYVVSELKKILNLNTDQLCILIALLGNYILSNKELKDIYERAETAISDKPLSIVKKLATYLGQIDTSSDLNSVALQILKSDDDSRLPKLKQSIQYYLDGTKDGFLKYRSSLSEKKRRRSGKHGNRIGESVNQEPNLDTTKLASENIDNEKHVIGTSYDDCSFGEHTLNNSVLNGNYNLSTSENVDNETVNESLDASNKLLNSSIKSTDTSSSGKQPTKEEKPILPFVANEVMRTVSERHSKGLMSPLIYQIFTQGEIKLPILLEDFKELPSIHSFYKPVRQMIYAVMFNLNHHRFLAQKNKTELNVDIRIKEWTWSKKSNKHEGVYVKAEPIRWGVPTVQRLWFGTTSDDKIRRVRTFLTCMHSDTQRMLNPDFVPQHLIIVASVLRYIMSFPDKKILRRPELDAFIVTALSPELMNPDRIQDLEIPTILSRGIQLAVLFMQGVQTALLANDACGSPIPWLMSCPWLYFDGKLFQYVYYRSGIVKNLHELCEGRVEMVMKAERMKQAILDGLSVQFAKSTPLFSYGSAAPASSFSDRNFNVRSANVSSLSSRTSFRPPLGLRSQRYSDKSSGTGGQLEVGGVVVSNWGGLSSKGSMYSSASYGTSSSSYLLPSQTSIGGGYGVGGYTYRTKYSHFSRTAGVNKGRGIKASVMKKKPTKKVIKGRVPTTDSSSANDASNGTTGDTSVEEKFEDSTISSGNISDKKRDHGEEKIALTEDGSAVTQNILK